jgi:hypothetical protein
MDYDKIKILKNNDFHPTIYKFYKVSKICYWNIIYYYYYYYFHLVCHAERLTLLRGQGKHLGLFQWSNLDLSITSWKSLNNGLWPNNNIKKPWLSPQYILILWGKRNLLLQRGLIMYLLKDLYRTRYGFPDKPVVGYHRLGLWEQLPSTIWESRL